MSIGIRTESLRKVFTSPPPIATPGRGFGMMMARGLRNKEKQKYEVIALDGVSLEVHPGEVFGLLGPNGAGKSTTVGVLTTRIRPTAGTAWIGDHNVWQRRMAVKNLIGVVPQRPNLDFGLTAREVLTFHGAYFGISRAERERRADALLDRFKLTDRAHQLLHGFSGGMMQRLSIARAMMHEPEVLFLDEPTMLFVFIFGRIMTTSGYVPLEYKSILLPGIIALSMVMAGVWSVAMPLIAEFQFTREIEDRLLAPMEIEWLAVEKIVAGMVQALLAGLVVLPTAWLVMGGGIVLQMRPVEFVVLCLLVSFLAGSAGLVLGCSVGQTQIGLMFTLVLAPMITFGCTYYPWSSLKSFPILQKAVLINPIVYVSEGFRGALVPQFQHLSGYVVLVALVFFDALFIVVGLRQFRKKALS